MSDPITAPSVPPAAGKQFFGHPRGLVTCFLVEFFERFTYYGMRTMLLPFLTAATVAENPGFELTVRSRILVPVESKIARVIDLPRGRLSFI